MNDPIRDRAGRVLGGRALAARDRLLDSLSELVEKRVAWRRISPIKVARGAGVSSTLFYLYFEELEDALVVLASRTADAGGEFSEHMQAILDLLTIEGWKLPEFPTETEEAVDA